MEELTAYFDETEFGKQAAWYKAESGRKGARQQFLYTAACLTVVQPSSGLPVS